AQRTHRMVRRTPTLASGSIDSAQAFSEQPMAKVSGPRLMGRLALLIMAMALIMGLALLGGAVQGQSQPDEAPPGKGGSPGAGQPKRRGPGALFPDPVTALAKQMLADGDKNGDQKLSRDEFISLADIWFDKIDPDK